MFHSHRSGVFPASIQNIWPNEVVRLLGMDFISSGRDYGDGGGQINDVRSLTDFARCNHKYCSSSLRIQFVASAL